MDQPTAVPLVVTSPDNPVAELDHVIFATPILSLAFPPQYNGGTLIISNYPSSA
jgi:hypothetical protein